jgi:hypothetical protein
MNNYYNKYIAQVQRHANMCIVNLRQIALAPSERPDESIRYIDALIAALQDVKRTLIYFKNRQGSGNPPPSPGSGGGPGVA